MRSPETIMGSAEKMFLNNNQYHIDYHTDFMDHAPAIINLIQNHSGVYFPWLDEQALKQLTEDDLIAIRNASLKDPELGAKLRALFVPYVKPHLDRMFGGGIQYDIRVSAQIKRAWNQEMLEKDNRDDHFYSDLAFPTRAHQDLDNNGFRSSHTTIFYFQMTPNVPHASNLEIAVLKDKVGLLAFTQKRGYSNEITREEQERLTWFVPDLTPGNIYYMGPYLPHRSSVISEFPRLALNVKIQPTNLVWLEKIYKLGLKKLASFADRQRKLSYLTDLLKEAARINNGISYELGITELLRNNWEGMETAFAQLCLYDVLNDAKAVKLLAIGGLLRKTSREVTEEDFVKLDSPMENIARHSCADVIMETLKLYL